jgi:hypothetical protein
METLARLPVAAAAVAPPLAALVEILVADSQYR